ncbi:recombinase RecA [Candidatus Entotheonella serta]|nr:recombinase RecA [Candidatus Entotheonella serta]
MARTSNNANEAGGEKQRALDLAFAQIEKQYGKGSIMRLGESQAVDIPVISSGSLVLDSALGVGGLPRGRIIEIYGPEASGKTTIALHAVASVQRSGGEAAFIDAEHALDPVYARNLGVNIDNLLIAQPDSGEQALEIADVLVRSGALDIVIVDSVAALVPQAEIDGDMGDAQMGLQARLMSQAMRKLTGIVHKTKTCVVFINQLRQKIGVFFGNPETTTGGNALKFYASVRLDIRRADAIKTGQEIIGNRTRVKIVKNKVAPPFKQAEFDIMYGTGISAEGELLDLAVQHNIIDKSGAWFSHNGDRIGQGRDNAKTFLKENPDIAVDIESQVRQALDMPQLSSEMLAAKAEAASMDEAELFDEPISEPEQDALLSDS